jgi:hypothetical protein
MGPPPPPEFGGLEGRKYCYSIDVGGVATPVCAVDAKMCAYGVVAKGEGTDRCQCGAGATSVETPAASGNWVQGPNCPVNHGDATSSWCTASNGKAPRSENCKDFDAADAAADVAAEWSKVAVRLTADGMSDEAVRWPRAPCEGGEGGWGRGSRPCA